VASSLKHKPFPRQPEMATSRAELL
jgi:hypothetical protein